MRHPKPFHPMAKRGSAPPATLVAVILAALSFGALAGCSQAGTSPGSGTSPSSSGGEVGSAAPPSGAAGPITCKPQLTVVPSDYNKTLCVTVGGTVTIDLGPGATVPGQPFDVSGNSLKAGAEEGVFAAVSPGTAVVTTERRNCPKPSPGSGMVACNSIQLWKVTITVR